MESVKIFGVFLLAVACLFHCILAIDPPVIKTKSGPIRGKLLQVPAAKQDIYEFIGIPFAEPPIGERRFKKPAPKTPWTDVFDATKQPKACKGVKLAFLDAVRGQTTPAPQESEDCLILNIWVPRATLDSMLNGTLTQPLAVYVFIHGGGFISGNTHQYLYFNGTIMGGFNNIIFASIQYRLASFGFAYFGKNDDAPGNAGLWDQVEGLKWISENIAAFGGNNSEITIGGESAGAASVTYHLLSPYSRKYFQRAVVESASATCPWAFHSPELAMQVTNIILNQTTFPQCSQDSSIADKIKCLRSVDASVIAGAEYGPMMMGYGFGSVPTADGDFIPRDPQRMIAEGDFYRAPLLIGANHDEGAIFMMANSPEAQAMLPGIGQQEMSLHDLNYTHYNKLMEISTYILSGTPRPNGLNPSLLNAIKLHYWPTNHIGFPFGCEVAAAAVQSAGDFGFTCPTYGWANATATYQRRDKIPVFVYHFSQRMSGSIWPNWMGVLHADELGYVFGEPLAPWAQGYGYSYDDKLLSKTIMEYWANFIKHGDPNIRSQASCNANKSAQPVGPESCKLRNWPTYLGEEDCPYRMAELNVQAQVFNNGEAFSCAFKARDCMFWTELYPKLEQAIANGRP